MNAAGAFRFMSGPSLASNKKMIAALKLEGKPSKFDGGLQVEKECCLKFDRRSPTCDAGDLRFDRGGTRICYGAVPQI